MRLRVGVPVAVALAAATVAFAQSGPEKLCFGGRNQTGHHLCACDQTTISGMSALVLGGSVVLKGPTTLQTCLDWAEAMNGGASTSSGTAGWGNGSSSGSDADAEAGTTQTPNTRPPVIPAQPDTSGSSMGKPPGKPTGKPPTPPLPQTQDAPDSPPVEEPPETGDDVAGTDTALQDPPPLPAGGTCAQLWGFVLLREGQFGNDFPYTPIANYFNVSPESGYHMSVYALAPAWRGTVTLEPGGRLFLSGARDLSDIWYLKGSNVIVCVAGGRCVSVSDSDENKPYHTWTLWNQTKTEQLPVLSSKDVFGGREIELTTLVAASGTTPIGIHLVGSGLPIDVAAVYLVVDKGRIDPAAGS